MRISNSKISVKISLLFGLSLLGFYFLNRYTHIRGDDFLYKFIFTIPRDTGIRGVRVESISDIITSQYNHYFVQNGRVLLNGVAQLFLIPDNKLWFNIVNTLLFGLLQILMLKRSASFKSTNVYQYLLLILCLWFLIPGPNQTFLWLDGSINYLWGMIIILLFLAFFDRIRMKRVRIKHKYLPLIFIVGFLSGFTHEVFTIGVSGALCIGVLMNYKEYRPCSLILIFGFLVGAFIMLISPGNLIRFNDHGIENHSIYYMFLQRCYGFVINFKYLSAFWFMMVLLSVVYLKDRTGFKKIYREHELIVHSIIISLVFIFLARAYNPPRVYFGISVFSIIIILFVFQKYYKLLFSNKSKIIYVVLIVFAIIEFSQVVSELRANMIGFKKDEATWFKSDDNVFVYGKKNKNRFSLPIFNTGPDGLRDWHAWENKNLSWYYNKEFMMFIPSDLYENVYKSNRYLTEKNVLKIAPLKVSSEGVKLYKSPKNNFLLYKLHDSVSVNIVEDAHVKYISNTLIKYKNLGFFNRIKSTLGVSQVSSITSETEACFVLPTKYGNYLVLNSPLLIPFENLEEIVIYPSKNDTIPILSF